MTARTVSVFGATGSVGTQTLELIGLNPAAYRVRALVAHRNAEKLAALARLHRAEVAVVTDEAAYPALARALTGSDVRAEAGNDAALAAAALPADWTMAAITGAAGLAPTLAAIRRGGTIVLANKESLVCAGDVVLAAVRDSGATLLPADSEHNAIFQTLEADNAGAIEKIALTASGGPFRTFTSAEMQHVTPEMAVRHPVWSMGMKISVDSATLMNKGLELIEAARLFDLTSERIDVIVHPQSVVHGLVYYRDGSVLAQLGSPDMRVPIGHTLAWPQRMATPAPRLDLVQAGTLTFEPPDMQRFPALRLARDALVAGGGAPTVLNAANEVAVAAFLAHRIGFLDIARIVEGVLARLEAPQAATLDAVMALDLAARHTTEHLIARVN